MRRLLLLLATVLATVAATLSPPPMLAGPAAADAPALPPGGGEEPGRLDHLPPGLRATHPGQPGTPGGGQEEDCGQDQVTPGPGDGPYFCSGGVPCAYTTNVVPLALPTTDPEPGKQWQVMICHQGGAFTKEWVQTGGTQPRPLIVQAQEAYGNLAPPGGAGPAQPGHPRHRRAGDLAVAGPGHVRRAARQLGRGPGRGGPAGRHERGPPATAGRSAAPAPARRTGRPAAATARTPTAGRPRATRAR